jgi:hypothetical protein
MLGRYSDGRRATGWTARVRFPERQNFNLLYSVQAGSGARPASYPMGTGGDFPGVERPRSEADHSPPSNAEIKNDEAIPPIPLCLYGIVLN